MIKIEKKVTPCDRGEHVFCPSMHGIGFAIGSYWDVNDIICGICGFRIKDPPPTGNYAVYERRKGLLGILGFETFKENIPTWPDFIIGARGSTYQEIFDGPPRIEPRDDIPCLNCGYSGVEIWPQK